MSGSIYTAARRYADATEVDRFAWFCSTKLIQSVDQFAGRPLKLEGWQKRFLAEALALDAAAKPYWGSVVLLVPRKCGKTSLMAAYALFRLLGDEGAPEILLAAASDKQAGRMFDSVVSLCASRPSSRRRCICGATRGRSPASTVAARSCACRTTPRPCLVTTRR